jgi:hypothetical protein
MASIHFVLDRSGSMWSCVDDTLGGFNHFIQSQKNDNPDGIMSLNLFAHDFDTIYEKKCIKSIEKLTKKNYFPRGATALLDAIGRTIKKAEKDEKPMIVILTDGQENSSKIYTYEHIKDLIDMKKTLGWNFVFLGANQDAIQVGGKLGIDEESAMTFNPENVYNAFEGLTCAVGRQVSGQDASVNFSGLERQASQPVGSECHDDVFSESGIERGSEYFAPQIPETNVVGSSVFVGSGLARC